MIDERTAKVIETIKEHPVKIANELGFTLLTDLHNDWMKAMLRGTEDETLQAHRGSYKTTCVAVALSLYIVCKPNTKVVFFRKTGKRHYFPDSKDVAEGRHAVHRRNNLGS